MKRIGTFAAIAFGWAAVLAAQGAGQQPGQQPGRSGGPDDSRTSQPSQANTITLTGCLERGGAASGSAPSARERRAPPQIVLRRGVVHPDGRDDGQRISAASPGAASPGAGHVGRRNAGSGGHVGRGGGRPDVRAGRNSVRAFAPR